MFSTLATPRSVTGVELYSIYISVAQTAPKITLPVSFFTIITMLGGCQQISFNILLTHFSDTGLLKIENWSLTENSFSNFIAQLIWINEYKQWYALSNGLILFTCPVGKRRLPCSALCILLSIKIHCWGSLPYGWLKSNNGYQGTPQLRRKNHVCSRDGGAPCPKQTVLTVLYKIYPYAWLHKCFDNILPNNVPFIHTFIKGGLLTSCSLCLWEDYIVQF